MTSNCSRRYEQVMIFERERGLCHFEIRYEKTCGIIKFKFLISCQQLGFYDTLIREIKECISIVPYSLISYNIVSSSHLEDYARWIFYLCTYLSYAWMFLCIGLSGQSLNVKLEIVIKISSIVTSISCLLFMDNSLLHCETPQAVRI